MTPPARPASTTCPCSATSTTGKPPAGVNYAALGPTSPAPAAGAAVTEYTDT
jgi:hypothetical protein